MAGYVQRNYGNNFFPDNSFKRCYRYHNHGGGIQINNFFGGSNLWGLGGIGGFATGGCRGGFWHGAGAALGFGLMGMLFNGLGGIGGGIGLGGNNYGNSYGNSWWGSRSDGRTSGDKCSCGCNGDKADKTSVCKDGDKVKIKELRDKLNNPDALNEAEAKALYKEIEALAKKPVDEADGDINKITYDLMLTKLETIAKTNGWNLTDTPAEVATGGNNSGSVENSGNKPAGVTPDADGAEGAKDAGGTPDATAAQAATGVVSQEEPSDIDGYNLDDNIISEEDFNKLTPEDKAKVTNKYKTLLDNITDLDQFQSKLAGLPDSLRLAVKEAYYAEAGYGLYSGDAGLQNGDVIQAVDLSKKTRATVRGNGKDESTITVSGDDAKHPNTIVIHDSRDIKYTYSGPDDGAYVYVSDQDRQEYALLKRNDGSFDLVQLKWHEGYGRRDWSPKA